MTNQNKKLFLAMSILFPIWLLISFGLIYHFMSQELIGSWSWSNRAFNKYLLFIHPISMIWTAYILIEGRWLNLKNKIKPFLVISSILLVFAFTMIQWTSVTTIYGQYGTSVKHSPNELFLLTSDATPFERGTLYREAMDFRYDSVFKKIWTFGAFVFFSTFLLLQIIPDKNIEIVNRDTRLKNKDEKNV